MPAKQKIYSKKPTYNTWVGEATDDELIDAITRYQQEVKSNPDYLTYNEILDLSTIRGINSFVNQIG